MNATIRLEFNHVYPELEARDLLYYLSKVSPRMLLEIIGSSNTLPPPNFNNFCSDKNVSNDIVKRVNEFTRKFKISEKPELVTREGSLRIAEIILSNKNQLIEKSKVSSSINDEINILNSFLIINAELNKNDQQMSSANNFDKIVDVNIASIFPISDTGIYKDNNHEFLKLSYATLIKFEYLIEFLNNNDDYEYLRSALKVNFNQESLHELIIEVKYFIAKMLELKVNNNYKFSVDRPNQILFLNSLVSSKIEADLDFTNLKIHPLYKFDNNTFSVIDFFFSIDKLYKSLKFVLKNAYHIHFNLDFKDRSFFEFYNTEFSENVLMKKILDQIFNKKYFIKKDPSISEKSAPDYYVRHGSNVFLFEFKDVLINKKVKSSSNIMLINETLSKKFRYAKKPIGIGQLITSIEQILNKKFNFDKYTNQKNVNVYPILLLSDRIFEIPGLNYRLNTWFKIDLERRLPKSVNISRIKELAVMDIDTLIFHTHLIIAKDSKFKALLNEHLKAMRTMKKSNISVFEERIEKAKSIIKNQIAPFSYRLKKEKFDTSLFTEKLKDIIEH
jgi:hypothetical protein